MDLRGGDEHVVAGGHQDDARGRCGRLPREPRGHLQPAHPGHLLVEQDDGVGAPALRGCDRVSDGRLAGVGLVNDEPLAAQAIDEDAPCGGVVVGDEDAAAGARCRRGGREGGRLPEISGEPEG